jgi:serine-type D-Ala-D-Ala carboxypeptidase (penicillin-binding protein 5/6)
LTKAFDVNFVGKQGRRMFHRVFYCNVFLLTFLFLKSHLLFAFENLDVASTSAILINSESESILFEKNAYQQHYPASTLKLATALYAYKKIDGNLDVDLVASQEAIGAISWRKKRDSGYKTPAHWLEFDACHMGIKKGEKLSLRVLFEGMLVASADDAANMIAEYVGNGSYDEFMTGMNTYLKSIGCLNTNLVNPHGLFHPDQKTTAYDLAIIAKHAFAIPFIRQTAAKTWVRRPKTNKQDSTVLQQTNGFIRKGTRFYTPQVVGGKTGTISKARALVIVAEDRGRDLVAVVLDAPSVEERYEDIAVMINTAFKEEKVTKTLISKGKQVYALEIQGAKKTLKTYTKQELDVEYFPSGKPLIKGSLYWDSLTLPVEQGQKVGGVIVKLADQGITVERSLFAVGKVELTAWSKLKLWVERNLNNPSFSILAVVFVVLLILIKTSLSTGTRRSFNRKL